MKESGGRAITTVDLYFARPSHSEVRADSPDSDDRRFSFPQSKKDDETPSETNASVEKSLREPPRHDEIKKNAWASHVARYPWLHFGFYLIVSLTFSAIGLFLGDLAIDAELTGWLSRGTDIGDKQSQVYVVQRHTGGLLSYDEGWNILIENVQPSWEKDATGRRTLEEGTSIDPFACDLNWYEQALAPNSFGSLWPVWRTTEGLSAFEPDVLRDICLAEATTQQVLESNGFCGGCPTGCLPPFSIVSFARIQIGDFTLSQSCAELATSWGSVRPRVESILLDCASSLRSNYTIGSPLPSACPLGFSPHMLDSSFAIDGSTFLGTTSTVFATAYNGNVSNQQLYDISDQYDRADASELVRGTFDTNNEAFNLFDFSRALWRDTALAVFAGAVTTLAMLIHTKSLWLTFAGLIQIFVSFPLAYFFYRFVLGIVFFPFLNFLGVYVVLALGADDVFVAVDKWKNARIAHPSATREEIASLALPDAAAAMLLTTVTTAAAFWATTICPVASLRVFAIFLGVLIIFDYLLCIAIVFPALCLYDRWKEGGNAGCCVDFSRKRPEEEAEDSGPAVGVFNSDEVMVDGSINNSPLSADYTSPWRRPKELAKVNETMVDDSINNSPTSAQARQDSLTFVPKPSLITRILTEFYRLLHISRYVLIVLFLLGFIVSIFYSVKLQLPETSDVRQLAASQETELNYSWRRALLYEELFEQIGRHVQILWGVTPADTGNHLNPDDGSQLVLDNSFDPTPRENQVHLQRFCQDLVKQDFARLATDDFKCPLDVFETWLSGRSNATDEVASQLCPTSMNFPVEPGFFDVCIGEFLDSSLGRENSASNRIYQRNGTVEIIRIPYRHIGVTFNSGYNTLDKAYQRFDGFLQSWNDVAPEGVSDAFGSSFDFWWYETNGKMFFTAYAGTGIALCAVFFVLLFSSRSLLITLFAVFTIADILFTVSMLLYLSGWSLGFLEAICFAILVGMSCDFVLHFGHSYCSLPGNVDRHTRTKHALIKMGPSILAAAITTIAAAIVMMFAQLAFFRRFALILLYTMTTGLIGSFVVFFVLTDTFGPSEPTKRIDGMFDVFRDTSGIEQDIAPPEAPKITIGRKQSAESTSGDSDSGLRVALEEVA